jgi:hypothetical protein
MSLCFSNRHHRLATIKYGMFRASLLVVTAIVALSSPIRAQSASQTPADASDKVSADHGEQEAAWEIAADKRWDELIHKNGPGTDTPLRSRLLKMRSEDQSVRDFSHGQQTSTMIKNMMQQQLSTDARLTRELKRIVEQKGWPTISLVGIDASNSAMLILTHTRDHDWQRQLLPELQLLADADKIDASALALVVDKEFVAEGRLQRYGSQFKFANGAMAMYAVEDPSGLDQRRAKALLPPMVFYKQMLSQMYHVKATDDVITAIPESKQ